MHDCQAHRFIKYGKSILTQTWFSLQWFTFRGNHQRISKITPFLKWGFNRVSQSFTVCPEIESKNCLLYNDDIFSFGPFFSDMVELPRSFIATWSIFLEQHWYFPFPRPGYWLSSLELLLKLKISLHDLLLKHIESPLFCAL